MADEQLTPEEQERRRRVQEALEALEASLQPQNVRRIQATVAAMKRRGIHQRKARRQQR